MSHAPFRRPAFRDIPYMGVIFVVAEAMKLGFRNGHPDWCNLGQGQPEVGEMAGAPPRVRQIDLDPADHAYGHLGGTDELREAVAAHYNRLYRRGSPSQYTAENVSIASGGRLALTRAFTCLSEGNLGYQVPDYTAYEDMMAAHDHRVAPIVVPNGERDGFSLSAKNLADTISDQGLTSFVLSNPCNPTGTVIAGSELESIVALARRTGCLFLMDEFYSHFIYEDDGRPGAGPVSAAPFVEDVDKDPILLIDGLTKCFRYPGWRIGWAVGPKSLVETIGRAASAIDGGPSRPAQRGALTVLEPERADQETRALRAAFSIKRNLMVERLEGMGIRLCPRPRGTFYAWGCLDRLPAPFHDADTFFRLALERKVMTVPGAFFDVNPSRRRPGPSPYRSWMRFSFGPPLDNVRLGLDRLEEMLRSGR